VILISGSPASSLEGNTKISTGFQQIPYLGGDSPPVHNIVVFWLYIPLGSC